MSFDCILVLVPAILLLNDIFVMLKGHLSLKTWKMSPSYLDSEKNIYNWLIRRTMILGLDEKYFFKNRKNHPA